MLRQDHTQRQCRLEVHRLVSQSLTDAKPALGRHARDRLIQSRQFRLIGAGDGDDHPEADKARAEGRDFERVQALLTIGDVISLESNGITRDADTVLELLTLGWQAGVDGCGRLLLEFSGDGTLAAEVECINLDLRDVTRPYRAVSGKAPSHPD